MPFGTTLPDPDTHGPFGWRAPYRGLEAFEPEDAQTAVSSADRRPVRDRLRFLGPRNLDHAFRDQRARDARPEKVLSFVDRPGLHHGKDEVAQTLRADRR